MIDSFGNTSLNFRNIFAAVISPDGRVSRKPGVCFATSGPGATNLVTGMATAQADSSPMIAVTGQVPVHILQLRLLDFLN